MLNIEFRRSFFKNTGDEEESYIRFLKKHALTPLELGKHQAKERQVTIANEKENVTYFSTRELAVYNLQDLVDEDRYVISFQRRSLKGIEKMTPVIEHLKEHPAFLESNENDYFHF